MSHWSPTRYDEVLALADAGLDDREITDQTGVPRSTIGRWRRGQASRHGRTHDLVTTWHPSPPATYAYVLGLYLGDGHIRVSSARAASLFLSLDRRYPAIVEQACAALAELFEPAPITCHHPQSQLSLVRLSHPAIPLAFPQHGPGKKHLRPIELAPWQSELTAHHPEALLRGLIHSDGCRTVNRFEVQLPSGRTRRYEYSRYFFSNLSADIRHIFTDHCELLGIRWSQSNARNVSISQRASVARLEEIAGPKA